MSHIRVSSNFYSRAQLGFAIVCNRSLFCKGLYWNAIICKFARTPLFVTEVHQTSTRAVCSILGFLQVVLQDSSFKLLHWFNYFWEMVLVFEKVQNLKLCH